MFLTAYACKCVWGHCILSIWVHCEVPKSVRVHYDVPKCVRLHYDVPKCVCGYIMMCLSVCVGTL